MVNTSENVAVTTTDAPVETTVVSVSESNASTTSADKSLTPVQLAMVKAKDKITADDAATIEPDKQAASMGDSTSPKMEEVKPDVDESGTSASTPLEPSPYWDKKTVELFNALPNDDSKRVVAEAIGHATKEQQAVFTKGMQSLAEEKK